MLKAFLTWDPVSSGTYKSFDEPYAYENNRWFFDKSVWQKMFRTLGGCGFNAMVLANTHPFPFMLDLSAYPEARMVDENELSAYAEMHHWIFENALDYDIAPYLLFYNIYLPEPLLEAQGISVEEMSNPTDFALEYTHYCTRRLLETYPELVGIVTDVGHNISERREEFLQRAIIDAVDAARPDISLCVRGLQGDPEHIMDRISRRGGRQISYCVKYSGDHLIDSNPDPGFNEWSNAVGSINVIADVHPTNFEPWTCFSYETAEDLVNSIGDLGCEGFLLSPLSIYDWPRTSDTYMKFQWQRDLVWYSVWGGAGIEKLLKQGQPKWLLRNRKLIEGFQAGSRILELLSLYFAGDKTDAWKPQFCCVREPGNSHARLLSIADMVCLGEEEAFSAHNWWEEVTGDPVVHLASYLREGTPEDAYGPDELIEELADLAEQAAQAGEKGMRNASGEKELPSLARDALCMGRLGEFYVERLRAALSHARGDDEESLQHMFRALGFYKEIRAIDSAHRNSFRISMSGHAVQGDWSATVKALEDEYTDATNGHYGKGEEYIVYRLTPKV